MSESTRLQTILRNRKRHHPVPEVSVGRRAELAVEAMLVERLEGTAWDYSAGLRVPHGGRRREIDFVISTPDELWVVELKNWSGFVGVDEGGHVIQHRSAGRGVVDHGRLLGDMDARRRALRNYLRRSLDEIPTIRTLLVFYDRRVGLDDSLTSAGDVEVMRRPEFLSLLPDSSGPGFIERLVHRVFGGGDDTPALPAVSEPIRQAREHYSKLGTWDLLALYGGQLISGDLVGASMEELSDRERFQRFRLDVPRGVMDLLFRSPLEIDIRAVERGGESAEFRCGFEETIRFHCAGDRKPKTFELRDVEALVLSR